MQEPVFMCMRSCILVCMLEPGATPPCERVTGVATKHARMYVGAIYMPL